MASSDLAMIGDEKVVVALQTEMYAQSSNIIENYSLEQDETGIYAGVYTDALTFPIIAVFQDMTGKVKRVVIINNMGYRSKKNRK